MTEKPKVPGPEVSQCRKCGGLPKLTRDFSKFPKGIRISCSTRSCPHGAIGVLNWSSESEAIRIWNGQNPATEETQAAEPLRTMTPQPEPGAVNTAKDQEGAGEKPCECLGCTISRSLARALTASGARLASTEEVAALEEVVAAKKLWEEAKEKFANLLKRSTLPMP